MSTPAPHTPPNLLNVVISGVMGLFGLGPNASTTQGPLGLGLFNDFLSAAFVRLQSTFFNHTPTAIPTQTRETATGVITGTVGAMDAEGDPLTYAITSAPAHGSATVAADGSFTYTPDQGYAVSGGQDAFGVTVTEADAASHVHGLGGLIGGLLGALGAPGASDGSSITSRVTVTVVPINSAPVAGVPTTITDAVTGKVTGATHFTQPAGLPMTYTVSTEPVHGSVTVNTDGTFIYTPTGAAQHASSADTATTADTVDGFTVTASTGHGSTPEAVTVTVAPANNAPVAGTATVGTPDPLTGIVTGSVAFTDLDGDPLTYTVTTSPTKGSVVIGTDGTFTYTPSRAATGSSSASTGAGAGKVQLDTFTVTADDAHGASTPQAVAVPVAPAAVTPVNDPSVGPLPHNADMALENPPSEDRFQPGTYRFQVEPLSQGTTITATTNSGTVTQQGRFYWSVDGFKTVRDDGYGFSWTPAQPAGTPQEVVFTATRTDGTTSTITYRPDSAVGSGSTSGSGSGSGSTPSGTPTYTNLIPAVGDPRVPVPTTNAADGTTGPNAANAEMKITSSGWDSSRGGYLVVVDTKTAPAGTVVTATTTDNGRVEGYYPGPGANVSGAITDGYYAYTNGPDQPAVRVPVYQFMFYPNDGSNWSTRYPTIIFTARTPAGATSTITFRSPNPSNSGSATPLDPNQYPPTGPNAKNLEMVIAPTTTRRSDGSYVIDVIYAPSLIVTAGTPYGGLMRWPDTTAGSASYVWTPNGSTQPPVIVLTAHFSDGRTTTITYTP